MQLRISHVITYFWPFYCWYNAMSWWGYESTVIGAEDNVRLPRAASARLKFGTWRSETLQGAASHSTGHVQRMFSWSRIEAHQLKDISARREVWPSFSDPCWIVNLWRTNISGVWNGGSLNDPNIWSFWIGNLRNLQRYDVFRVNRCIIFGHPQLVGSRLMFPCVDGKNCTSWVSTGNQEMLHGYQPLRTNVFPIIKDYPGLAMNNHD